MTDAEAVEAVKRIAQSDPANRAPDPLRDALSRFLRDGHVDHHLLREDPVYHGIIALIERAAS